MKHRAVLVQFELPVLLLLELLQRREVALREALPIQAVGVLLLLPGLCAQAARLPDLLPGQARGMPGCP